MQNRRNKEITSDMWQNSIIRSDKDWNKEDWRKFDIQKINESLISNTNIKAAKRRLGIEKNQMCTVQTSDGDIWQKWDSQNKREILQGLLQLQWTAGVNTVIREMPNITKKIKRALKGMKRGYTPGEEGIIIDLIIDEDIIAVNDKCPQKGETMHLKIYRPISLLPVTFKLFTKIITSLRHSRSKPA